MRFLSLFSGIEAASVALEQLGWRAVAFAEIDAAPAAVLAERFPSVPNLGDVTKITDEQIAALGPIDVVIGGSPCQDLSVAGKRAGLAGERSSLFHEQVRIFHAARHLCGARFLWWENVPGAFSSHGGRDFAVVVGTLAGCTFEVPRNGWGSEGAAMGPHGLVEWSVLDAQWFGLAQRRERVFAVLDTGNWSNRPPILLEPESMRGDSPPRRETGQGIAPCISARTRGGGGLGTDAELDGALIPDVAPTLNGAGNRTGGSRPPGTQVDTAECLIPERERALTTSNHRIDAETETLLVTPPVGYDQYNDALTGDICSTMSGCDGGNRMPAALVPQPFTLAIRGRGDSHDLEYRQDGTANAILTPTGGRAGIGVGAVAFKSSHYTRGKDGPPDVVSPPLSADADKGDQDPLVLAFDTTQVTSPSNYSNPKPGDPCQPRAAGAHVNVDVAPTLRGMSEIDGNANGGGQMAVAFADVADPIAANRARTYTREGANNFRVSNLAHTPMQVRRITPRECERLQGFPDDWTLIDRKGKPMADGPRYKALGNSMAVPVIAWIGRQIQRAAQ